MSTSVNHLPECWCAGRCPTYEGATCPCRDCICDELRACEQRVNSSNLTMWNRTKEEAQHMINAGLGIAWKDGFKEGLDAAREAIRNREDGEYFPWVQVEIAIAAIDALREEQK